MRNHEDMGDRGKGNPGDRGDRGRIYLEHNDERKPWDMEIDEKKPWGQGRWRKRKQWGQGEKNLDGSGCFFF